MRAAFRVNAFIGKAQPLDRLAADEMLLHNLGCVGGLNVAVPDGFGVDHNGGSVFALVKTAGFVDAHLGAQSCGFGQLLDLRMEFALSIAGARRARGIGGTDICADKNMAFEYRQAKFLLKKLGRCG